jgi:DEAD/DEAH box helicase domain-containing protein
LSIAVALDRLYADRETAPGVVHHRVVPARAPRYLSTTAPLSEPTARALAALGLERLYVHQAQALAAALQRDDVVVVTPTASGKTLCYALPILERLAARPDSRAMLVYPTKALAHDQMDELAGLAAAAGSSARVLAYDRDTPMGLRPEIRRRASLLVTNPDMLHVSILPHHLQWREVLSHLDLIVIDELHSYRGVFGAHVANVVRRLQRICRFYGSDPQVICTSATIANPVELATTLTGRRPVLVDENGAPAGRRHVLLYNPPLLDPGLGIRRSAMADARHIANLLRELGLQTVVFCQSRGAVEQLLVELRQDAMRAGVAADSVRGYRGGYLDSERREIEQGLRSGQVRLVVATNALEVGVDIGGMAAAVLVGYPGSVASTWQRIGRAGRGSEDSLAVLVASASPLDQYIMTHADYLFEQAPERGLANPDNLHVLLGHVRCASHELPFGLDEAYGREDVQVILRHLEELGEVRRSRVRWHRIAGDYPAADISLRSAGPDQITIVQQHATGEQVIGTVDRDTAPVYVHEQAIYVHEGQQYLVERLEWDAGVAHVRPVAVDYFTRASGSSAIRILETREQASRDDWALQRGEIELTRQVTGYRRLRQGTLEVLSWGEVDLPEQTMQTEAMWLTLSDELVNALSQTEGWVGEGSFSRGPDWPERRRLALERDGHACRWCGATARPGQGLHVHHLRPYSTFGLEGDLPPWQAANALANLITLCPACHRLAEQGVAVRGSLAGLGHALRHLLPTLLLCDPGDVGVQSEPRAAQTGLATLFIYDDLPGGVGLSYETMAQFDVLVRRVLELVGACGCAYGCPSCIGPVLAEDAGAKARVLAAARRLVSAGPPVVV